MTKLTPGRLRRAAKVTAAVVFAGAIVAGTAVARAATAQSTTAARHAAVTASASTENMLVTLYGWDDNSPPGCATAYSGCAGGAGTFSNPTTFATDKAELPVGTLVYYAPLDRYFVMGDDCVECDQDWTGQGPDGGPNYRHIDLWAGGASGDNSTALINCEDNWTSNGQVPVLVNPPSGEPVANSGNGGPVFVASSSHCWQVSDNGGPSSGGGGGGYPTGFHQLVDQHSGDCLDISGDSLLNGAALIIWPCKSSGNANQEFAFHPVSGGYGELTNENSNKSLAVQSASTSDGAKVIQYTTNGTTNSLWLPESLGSGQWQFKNENSGLCLDVTGVSTTEGTQLQQWGCKSSASGTNQAFATR
ncbi:MAG TPA: RICIN domain-containing protein [Streptosporangiaceae bacterium]|nr:RICIN domain-containing protein [Streptosporangiaceae bacterium]